MNKFSIFVKNVTIFRRLAPLVQYNQVFLRLQMNSQLRKFLVIAHLIDGEFLVYALYDLLYTVASHFSIDLPLQIQVFLLYASFYRHLLKRHRLSHHLVTERYLDLLACLRKHVITPFLLVSLFPIFYVSMYKLSSCMNYFLTRQIQYRLTFVRLPIDRMLKRHLLLNWMEHQVTDRKNHNQKTLLATLDAVSS